MMRPRHLYRILEPLEGPISLRVSCVPNLGWQREYPKSVEEDRVVRFECGEENAQLRLTMSMPLTYLRESKSFTLSEKTYFALTWNSVCEQDFVATIEKQLAVTRDYSRKWVKHCSIPTLFQAETIRSALALKLHCYEDTGAILASITTSLPEDLKSQRNWDYRFCWLRDAYFALSAFHNLGHFEEMEGFLKFLLNIAYEHENSRERLAPVYTISRGLPLPETIQESWSGYLGAKPVRSFNQAAEHLQNDVYGERVLALSPIFFDQRFSILRDPEHEQLLENLARLASKAIGVPDAGLWELRSGWQEHSFTNLMSWAALDRVATLQRTGFFKGITWDVRAERERAERALMSAVGEGSLRAGPKDQSFDAALALAPTLRFPVQDVSALTLKMLCNHLCVPKTNCHFYRYIKKDDFGVPQSAFVVCSFWKAQGFAQIGEQKIARQILEGAMTSCNHLGLFAEHFDPHENRQLGNFPQAYSPVGLINAAFAVSPRWSDML